jgi:hypothetical protein
MAGLSGIDQSWGEASEAAVRTAVRKAGGKFVVSMYLSWDQSKNMTVADILRYHRAGAGLLFNWEHHAGAPLLGAAQGRADATEAVRQAKALIKAAGLKPANRITLYFSCDRDVTAAQIRGPVAAYYKAAAAVCHAARFGAGCYGEADLVHYLAAHGITDAEWQTYAWSRGVIDPAADFFQYLNGQTLGGASVDFDRIIHPTELGALWPPGHRYDVADGTPPTEPPDLLEEIMALPGAPKGLTYQKLLADIREQAQAAANSPLWVHGKTRHAPDTIVRGAVADHVDARLASLAAVTNDTVVRVGKLQAAVAALPAVQQAAADVAAIAAATAEAVVDKLRALVWGVK